jgi:hypothetical protein
MGRSAYWFPLVLLGFGLLVLLGWDVVAAQSEYGWFAYAPETSGIVTSTLVSMGVSADYPPPAWIPARDWPWAVLITVTFVATVAWYARRARRAERSARPYVVLTVAGGLAVPACYVVAGIADATANPAELVPSVAWPLLLLGVLTGAWAYFRLGPWRRTTATVGIVCTVTGLATVLGALAPGLLEPVLIGAGLLTLSWYERSRLLAAAAVAVAAALVVFPDGPLSTLIAAVLALATAIAALVRQNVSPAPG